MAGKARIAMIGVDYPHASAWRESIGLMDNVELVAMAKGPFDGTGTTGSAAPVPWAKGTEQKPVPTFDTVDELMEKTDFDGAMVMLSNAEKPAVCIRLAEAGKHVFAEKPVACHARDMERITQAIKKNGVRFSTGYTWRYHPIMTTVRDRIRAGEFGRVYAMQVRMLTSSVEDRGPDHFLFAKEHSGSGMVGWLGCHPLDILLFLFEQKVKSITGKVGHIGEPKVSVEDGGTAVLEFEDGALATLICGFYLKKFYGETLYSLQGTGAWADWTTTPANLRYMRKDMKTPQMEDHNLPSIGGYGGQVALDLINDWLDTAGNGAPPVNNEDNALRVLKIIDAIYESSETGRRVDVDV
ncbi:MAG: Gfo/Idh/MocA family oxidoreductase [Planctomycetes bacterium]|nr:Gfo/Idh/MocA family oxidoreductase [Planctomycetota bacterium]